jgi:hypothetical protein
MDYDTVSLIGGYQTTKVSEGHPTLIFYHEDRSSIFLWNAGNHLALYMQYIHPEYNNLMQITVLWIGSSEKARRSRGAYCLKKPSAAYQVSCLAYSSTMKIEAICYSEALGSLRTTYF